MERETLSSIARKHGLPAPKEDTEQIIVADWLRLHKILFHHSPNGGIRDQHKGRNGKTFSGTAMKLKRMGTSNGFPDILILDRPPLFPDYVGCVIEMKRSDSGRGKEDRGATEEQKEWLFNFHERGWRGVVAHGANEAIEYLQILGYGARR